MRARNRLGRYSPVRAFAVVQYTFEELTRRFVAWAESVDKRNKAGDFGKYPWQRDYGLWPWQRRRK